jgi:hypothetical protein
MTWQIARQQECATVWYQLAGSRGEFGRFELSGPLGESEHDDAMGESAWIAREACWAERRRSARCKERQSKAKWGARTNIRLFSQLPGTKASVIILPHSRSG